MSNPSLVGYLRGQGYPILARWSWPSGLSRVERRPKQKIFELKGAIAAVEDIIEPEKKKTN